VKHIEDPARRIRRLRRRVASAQRNRRVFAGWPDDHRAALSFSFDDSWPSQIEYGIPLFERLGIAATFFVTPREVAASLTEWRDAVARGHEMGNHTTTHPCSGNHTWIREDVANGRREYSREQMTLADFKWEVHEANRRLRRLLGLQPRVFAYPCGETTVGRGRRTHSLVPFISRTFDIGRTFMNVSANSPVEFDPAQTACVWCDGQTLQSLMPRLEAALSDRAWLVLGGHHVGKVGSAEAQTTGVDTIEAVVDWCRANRVWVDTVGKVGAVARGAEAPQTVRQVSKFALARARSRGS
jgi:peptidoglycan-N-acetylglucosamine deacetylase